MKEYEKLAEQHWEKVWRPDDLPSCIEEAYIAGFLEAREMSEEIVTNYPQLRRDIERLGEKEV